MKRIMFTMIISLILLSACTNNKREEWTSLAEGQTTQIPALMSAKVEHLLVQEGDMVKQGQTLAILDTMALAIQKQELNSALSELNVQKSLYDLQIKQAQNDLTYTNTKFKRTQSLVENNSAPEQNLDDLNNLKEKTAVNLSVLIKQKELLTQKQKQIDAKIMMINKNINDAIITAPHSGMISEIFALEKEAVSITRPILEIIKTESIEAIIYVNQTELAGFKIGDKMKVTVDGYKPTLTAEIIKINNQSEFTPKQILTPDTRTALVYGITVRILNPEAIIKDGMPVRISRS